MWSNIIYLIGQAFLMKKNRDWCQVVIQIRHEQDVGPTVEYLSTFHTIYKYVPLAQRCHQVTSMTIRQPIQLTKPLLILLFLALLSWSHFGLNFTACICSVGPRSSPLCLTLLGTVWKTWEQGPCSQSKTNYTNEEQPCPNEVSRVTLEDLTVHHTGKAQCQLVPIQ